MLSLRAIASRNPHGQALVDQVTALSFANLFDKSEVLAAKLELELELERNAHQAVAFVASNDSTSIALFLALVERGITALPLNPRLTLPEQRQLVETAGARWVEQAGEEFRDIATGGKLKPDNQSRVSPQQLNVGKVLVATSGSSGKPRLVELTANALHAAALACNQHLRVTARDRWLLSLNLAHIGGLAIVLRCLLAEATVIVAEPGMTAATFARTVERHAVSIASLVPTQLARMLITHPQPQFPTLRILLVGGAAAAPRLVTEARARGWPVLLTYGLSEAGSQVTTQPLSDLELADSRPDAGLKLPGVDLRIDEDGVICIRGPMLFDGYYGETDRPTFEDGWLRTGDLGRLTEEGRLVVLGRRDALIITGGEKVSPLEVETQILNHPNVRDVAVVGLPDPTWGEVVAAAVVLAPDAHQNHTFDGIVAMLNSQLAPFKRPRRWFAVTELPQLPNGKLDRRAVVTRLTHT